MSLTHDPLAHAVRWLIVAACLTGGMPAAAQSTQAQVDTTTALPRAVPLPLRTTRRIRFTTTEGTWMSLDVSPDGRTIVFDLLGDLYLLPIEGGRARRLTSGPAWDMEPRFSPDGRRIAFVSDRTGMTNLWVMDSEGRHMRQVSGETQVMVGSPVWLPDGHAVLARRIGIGTFNMGTVGIQPWIYPVDGGLPHPALAVETVGGATQPWAPQFSGATITPDGREAYLSSRGSPSTIVRLDLVGGLTTPVSGLSPGALRPVVAPNGHFLVYPLRVEPATVLRLHDLTSGEDRLLAPSMTRDDGEYDSADDFEPGYAFTPDSRSVVYTDSGHIKRVDVATGAVRDVPFVATVDQCLAPLLATSHQIDSDSLTVRQMTGFQFVPRTSSAGERVVFSAVGRIWVTSLLHPRPVSLTARTGWGGYAFDPAISPDGRSIAYVTLPDTVPGHLWITPIDGGVPRWVDQAGGDSEPAGTLYYAPAWTSDGRALIATRRMRDPASVRATLLAPALVRVPASGGAVDVMIDLANSDTTWGGDGSREVYAPEAARIVAIAHDDSSVQYADYVEHTREGTLNFTVSLRSAGLHGQHTRTVLRVTNVSRDLDPVTRDCMMSPDGQYALVQRWSNAYLLPVPRNALAPDTDEATAPGIRLSTTGARDLQWLDSGRTIAWSYANHFYRVARTEVVAASTNPTRWHISDVMIPLRVPRPTPHDSLVLRGARIVTMRGNEVIERGDVLIHNDRIAAVGASGALHVPPGVHVIDVSGTTIIPGIVETHKHPAAGALLVHGYLPDTYLRHFAVGVTTVRDPNGPAMRFFQSEDIDATGPPEPRLFTTGPGMTGLTVPIRSLADARYAVRRYGEDGAVALKQYQEPTRLQRQWLRIAAGEAGDNVTNEGLNRGYANGMTMVLDGFTGIEHAPMFTVMYHDALELIARSGTIYTPGGVGGWQYWNRRMPDRAEPRITHFTPVHLLSTSDTLGDTTVFRWQAHNAAEIVRLGGRVSAGSHDDQVNTHVELWSYALGGMTPLEVLRCATLYGAQGIGYGDELGSIEPGKLADLVILNSNPLADITKSRDIRYVMKGGALYDSQTLDEVWPEVRPLPHLPWQPAAGP